MKEQLNIVKGNFKEAGDKITKAYDNNIIDIINDHCLRLAVMNGEYQWHFHENTDELFIVMEGRLKIEIIGGDTQILDPGDFIKIPAKTIHKTSSEIRTVNLCFEKNAEDTVFV